MFRKSFAQGGRIAGFSPVRALLKRAIAGLLVWWAAFYLLHWNEGRALQHAQGVDAGLAAVISINPDRVVAANDQKLVHLVGQAVVEGALTDPLFGVSAPAVKLQRQVEMYQWEERKHESKPAAASGGAAQETVVTYLYPKVWSGPLIFSGDFQEAKRHTNPNTLKFNEATQVANTVKVGAFALSSGLIEQFNSFEPLPLAHKDAHRLPAELREQVKVFDGMFYQSEDPQHPEVGDVRVRFLVVKPARVSLIARQTGNSFTAFHSGEPSQPELEMLAVGQHSSESMYVARVRSNAILTWGLRAVVFGLLWLGAGLVFHPLAIVGLLIPYVSDLFELGALRFSAFAATVLGLAATSFAWIGYRPIIGIGLSLAAAATIGLTLKLVRRRRA